MIKTKIGKGLIRTIVFYVLGLILTIIIHLLYGFGSPRTPPAAFFVLVFFTAVGVCWLLTDLFFIYFQKKATKEKGDLVVHILGLIVFSILIALLWIWGLGATAEF